jgi:hypothetical protein
MARDAVVCMLARTGLLHSAPLCGTGPAQQQLSLNCANPCNKPVLQYTVIVFTIREV